jgi:hypothetical protein
METITILNKSGKVVKTVRVSYPFSRTILIPSQSKHILSLFKDAKEAYQEKKAELKAEIYQREQNRITRKLENVRLEEVRSVTSSHRSHRRRHHRHRQLEDGPALTEDNLETMTEVSTTSSRRRHHHGSEHGHRSVRSPTIYETPYYEDEPKPHLARRHTDHPGSEAGQTSLPSYHEFGPIQRSMSSPNMHIEEVDMHLAYGDLPPPLPTEMHPLQKEAELKTLMSRMDHLLIEAQCIQHTAISIMATLQSNPEAMAAVALTLAEISNLLAKMSPGILAMLKGSSPAVFGLLASPQFLIAGGLAVGVTVVMFGGYKIIKKIQNDMAIKKEANRMEEAMVFEAEEAMELSTIETWRRGIAEAEAQSIATSVDGEFITPEASRIRKERIRERAREERRHPPSEVGSSASTIRRKEIPDRTSSRTVVSEARTEKTSRTSKSKAKIARSETGRSERSESTVKPRKRIEEKKKKPSALSVLFKKSKKDKGEKSEGHVLPKRIEI